MRKLAFLVLALMFMGMAPNPNYKYGSCLAQSEATCSPLKQGVDQTDYTAMKPYFDCKLKNDQECRKYL